MIQRRAAGLVLAACLVLAPHGSAQTPAPPSGQPPDAATPADQDDQDRPNGPAVRWRPLPSVRLGDRLRFDVHFRVQIDGRASEAPLDDEDRDQARFDLSRRRVSVEGVAFDVLEFEVEREITGDEPWRDVFVNYRADPRVQVQAGHFRLPFSLDQDIGATNRDFVSRSLAGRQLGPGRDPGVMVHGRVLRLLRYEAGVFRNDGRNARTRNPERVSGGRTFAWRLVAQPWRGEKQHALEDLQFGVARTSSDVPPGIPAVRGETALESVFFPSDTPVLGGRHRTGLEARWRTGPLSVVGEYIRMTTAREGQSVEETDLSPLLAHGWYLTGTWAITGEQKARGLASPRRPLFRGGPGAIELAARIERLSFGSTATGEPGSTSPRADVVLPNADRATTIGVNWYLNRYVKVQANVVRERLDDPARGPLPTQPAFWSRVLLLQITL